jgi:translation initiation factor 4G
LALPEAALRNDALDHVASGSARSWCRWSVFHVAEVEGIAASALCTFSASAGDDSALGAAVAAAFAACRIPPERLAGLAAEFAIFQRCFPLFPSGTWIVENVGTRDASRRRGLLTVLLDDALERGRRAGHATAQISCLLCSEPAQRPYERAGFRVVEERKDPAFEALMGTPGLSRMAVSL